VKLHSVSKWLFVSVSQKQSAHKGSQGQFFLIRLFVVGALPRRADQAKKRHFSLVWAHHTEEALNLG
jgi:hypothetical protein